MCVIWQVDYGTTQIEPFTPAAYAVTGAALNPTLSPLVWTFEGSNSDRWRDAPSKQSVYP